MPPDLVQLFRATRLVEALESALATGSHRAARVAGLQGSAPRLLAAALASGRSVLFVAEDEDALRTAVQDLSALLPPEDVFGFLEPDILEGEPLPLGWYEISHRMRVLEALARGRPVVVVATPMALLAPTLAPEVFRGARRPLSVGEEIDRDLLVDTLDGLGYLRLPKVDTMGECSVRGGIIDVYGPLSTCPIRIELFGDTVESIRTFEPATQRSTGTMDSITLVPVREFLAKIASAPPERNEPPGQAAGTGRAGKVGPQGEISGDDRALELLQVARKGKVPKGCERLLLYYPSQASLLAAHLSSGTLVLDASGRVARDVTGALARKTYGPEAWDELREGLSRLTRIECARASDPGLDGAGDGLSLEVACRVHPEYLNDLDRFLHDLGSYGEEGFTRVVAATRPGGRARLQEILTEAGFEVVPKAGHHRSVALVQADLEAGFVMPDEGIALVTENDLWHDRRVREDRLAREAPSDDGSALRFSDFSEITEGSLVVHYEHGVGRFLGLKELCVDGVRQDYLQLEYQKGDRLFVPVNQLDRVQRYVGVSEDSPVKLSRLGSARWTQAKSRVRQEVAELAKKLLELYAKREAAEGFACGPDNAWQQEMEGLFPFEETPDQLRCIREVKGDLTKARPMDRLLCGDVGYGKTEVAVRAAFKVVQEGRQVAVLVPTTILAEQHLHTFQTRMAAFPVNIGCLSRLRSPQQQRALANGAKTGSVDVMIGTHRLLSKDVKFKNLGLLVVDEEQRFGVTHKEKVKELKASVDVLTMTATPIPRTLNLAMSGARDISIITTSPRGRMPIKTFVLEYEEELVKGAIERELARGGQVYYVYNRIESMDVAAAWLKKLVPGASVRSGHGQMNRGDLEELMTDFYAGKFDVLLSTTIIESGLDVPNVNTIIVHRADCFGLSQLYQLRGRVGRTSRQAYAYLLYPSGAELTDTAFERLKALEEHTDLGSGFKIAMRDLELRGAGNILGASQHGFIDSIGFELYTRLLREAVADQKGRPEDRPREFTKLEVQVDCYIPSDYIRDTDNRIMSYRRLAECASEEELESQVEELHDRYGKLPEKLRSLLRLMRVKMKATDRRLAGIQEKEGRLIFRFAVETEQAEAPTRLVQRIGRKEPPPRPTLDAAALSQEQLEWTDHVRRAAAHSFRPESATSFSVALGARRNLDVLRLMEDLFGIPRPAGDSTVIPRRPTRPTTLRARRY